jgi:serine/threonine protein kinase
MNSESNTNSASSQSSFEESAYPRLNNTYELIKILGEGSTAKVWLARLIEEPSKLFAIKIMNAKFLKMESSICSVKKEIKILKGLDHEGIIKLLEFGDSGIITSESKLFINQVFIVLEYVEGSLLFDLCKDNGAMGEDVGRYFLRQMIETMEYMNKKGVVHRDIKLENILVDKEMKLKFADFGFATNKCIDSLQSYRGTMSYMAPEIRRHDKYDGR